MKRLRKLFNAITEPITALIVHIGVSREINEDGSWDNTIPKRTKGEKNNETN